MNHFRKMWKNVVIKNASIQSRTPMKFESILQPLTRQTSFPSPSSDGNGFASQGGRKRAASPPVCRHVPLVFVEGGLQQSQRVDQPAGETQTLARRAPKSRSLGAALLQIKLFLRLFADQLCLHEHTNNWFEFFFFNSMWK